MEGYLNCLSLKYEKFASRTTGFKYAKVDKADE